MATNTVPRASGIDTVRPVEAAALQHTLRLVPGTRTRRHHGAFMLGGHLACIYSTRSADRCYGVSFELGAGTLTLAGSMTPAQARSMARALHTAANAADLVLSQESGVCHG